MLSAKNSNYGTRFHATLVVAPRSGFNHSLILALTKVFVIFHSPRFSSYSTHQGLRHIPLNHLVINYIIFHSSRSSSYSSIMRASADDADAPADAPADANAPSSTPPLSTTKKSAKSGSSTILMRDLWQNQARDFCQAKAGQYKASWTSSDITTTQGHQLVTSCGVSGFDWL